MVQLLLISEAYPEPVDGNVQARMIYGACEDHRRFGR